MSVIGTVENGQVKLPPDARLPEGATVEVLVHEGAGDLPDHVKEILKLAKPRDWPTDFSKNFGQYLFGEERR